MNVPIRHLATILSILALLAASNSMSKASEVLDLNGTAWVLSALPGFVLQTDAIPTARFADARVQGSDGCNRYSAPYTVMGSSLRVDPRGATTQMACPPPIATQSEAFMGAMARTASYRVFEGQLQLRGADGKVVATFARQPQSLGGTSWRVTGYNNGKQAVVGPLSGTNLTMEFSTNGRVTGSAGCNSYKAAYNLNGANLAIGPAAATRRLCASPERVMEQELLFLKSLESSRTALLEGTRLELRDANGALTVVCALTTAP